MMTLRATARRFFQPGNEPSCEEGNGRFFRRRVQEDESGGSFLWGALLEAYGGARRSCNHAHSVEEHGISPAVAAWRPCHADTAAQAGYHAGKEAQKKKNEWLPPVRVGARRFRSRRHRTE